MQLKKVICMAALLLAGSLAIGSVGNASLPQPLCTRGEIVEVEDNSIVVKGEGAYPLVKVLLDTTLKTEMKPSAQMQGRYKTDMGLNLGLERSVSVTGTILVDGYNARPISSKRLTVGKQVVAYYDGNVTRSYPPQAKGEAVVLVTKADTVGQYFVVARVEMSKDRKAVTVTNTSDDLIAFIPGRACAAYREIKAGSRLLIWSDLMTLSLPAQTTARRARILR